MEFIFSSMIVLEEEIHKDLVHQNDSKILGITQDGCKEQIKLVLRESVKSHQQLN